MHKPGLITKILMTLIVWGLCLYPVFAADKAIPSGGRQKPEMYLQLGYKTGNDFNTGQELVFSPDGNLLAAVSGGNTIRIWEVATGREIQTLVEHGQPIKSIVFLPGNQTIVSGNNDKIIRLWDINSGQELRSLRGHQDGIFHLAATTNGAMLSSLEKKAIKLWDAGTGALLATIPAPIDEGNIGYVPPLVSAAFSLDNSKLVFTNLRGEIFIWGINERRIISTLGYEQTKSFNAQNILGLTRKGEVIVGGVAALIVIDPNKLAVTQKNFRDSGMYAEYMSADGSVIAGKSWQPAAIHVFDSNLKKLLVIPSAKNIIRNAYLPARKIAAVSTLDDQLKLYDLASGKELHNFSAKAFTHHGGAFSKDGGRIGVNVHVPVPGQYMSDVRTKVWNLKNAVMEKELNNKNQFFDSAEEGKISDYDELNACYYSVFSEPAVGTMIGSPMITIYRIVPKDQYDFAARLYQNRSQWKVIKSFKAHDQNVSAMAVTFKNGFIATGSFDKTINLFSYPGATFIRSFIGHTAEITTLAFSPDGSRLLSQSADQTTRLWDVATGRELVRFINFIDGEWIAITPEGYYNASPNGDRHLNIRAGSNIYGIENYREAFFRPDLVKLAISGESLQGYRTLADIKLPPKVSIVQTPVSSSTEDLKVTLQLEERGGGIGDVKLFLNGSAIMLDHSRAIQLVHKKSAKDSYRSYSLKLSPGMNDICAIAFNAENSMQSNEAVHQVSANFTAIHKPAMHALVIGIQDFKNPKLKLRYSADDAKLIASVLRKSGAELFKQVNVRLLITAPETTRSAIIKALEEYRFLRPDDLFVFFVASHGTVEEGEYFLLTSNVGSTSTDKIRHDALSQRDLKERIANIPATKKLIIIDTCNAAALGDAIQLAMLTRGMSEDTAMKVLSRSVGSTIISASTSVQEALEGYQGHGLLTWAFAQGLQGKADADKDGFIKTTELANYVDDEVPHIAEKQFKRAQYPTIAPGGQAFPVGKVNKK